MELVMNPGKLMNWKLVAYINLDWAGDKENRASVIYVEEQSTEDN
jgi:hypothetical protein